jgi:hypothetical protein
MKQHSFRYILLELFDGNNVYWDYGSPLILRKDETFTFFAAYSAKDFPEFEDRLAINSMILPKKVVWKWDDLGSKKEAAGTFSLREKLPDFARRLSVKGVNDPTALKAEGRVLTKD